MSARKQCQSVRALPLNACENEPTDGQLEVVPDDPRRDILVRSIEIFRLDLAIRELGRAGVGAAETEAARSELAGQVRQVARQRGASLQELHLKTQILCVLLESAVPDLCQELARSIRDDVGALCLPLARSGRREI